MHSEYFPEYKIAPKNNLKSRYVNATENRTGSKLNFLMNGELKL